ncbi:hypothetical protein [Pedobacter alpinus]|uniref:Lipoprotein n=1 Tax=Pedobacter alpinus TaxID=1590643 RepID=A0ABW5TNU3_9SPHI
MSASIKILFSVLAFSFFLVFLNGCKSNASRNTYIWVIRNAETDTLGNLNVIGKTRALLLDSLFLNENVDALIALKEGSNIESLKAISKNKDIEITEVHNDDLNNIPSLILEKQGAIVCLKREQIIPLIKRLGLEVNIDSIPENQFEYLFKIIIPTDSLKEKRLEVRYF